MKKKAVICSIITVLCIVAAVFLRFAMEDTNPEYTEVKATVVSSDNIVRKVLGKRQTQYEVVVEYEGQEYKLKNTHSSAPYIPGKEVTALLHDGKLYANIEGITSTTPVAMVYFVFLFGSFAMVCVSVTLISKARTEG